MIISILLLYRFTLTITGVLANRACQFPAIAVLSLSFSMVDFPPLRSRPASVTSNRSRASRLASHRLSTRDRRSSSPSPTSDRRSTSRGRQSRNRSPHVNRPSRPRPVASDSARRRNPFPQTFSGIQQDRPTRVGNFGFEQKYPEDVRYHEQGPNARVWRVYQDEVEVFDANMVGEARDSLDVLLVFAGLFSVVLATLVAQTSQSLSTNSAAISTSALLEITLLLRAQTNGVSLDSVPITSPMSSPSGLEVWLNGLWVVSLTLSLGAALLTLLLKQWLRQYMSMISGGVRDRSHIRQYRFDGLQKWHVLTFVAVMPIILYIVVGLFLAGLVLFLVPLRPVIASVVGAITLVVYGTYIVTNVLPLLCTQCPYRTPFSDVLNLIRHAIHSLFKPKSMIPFISLRAAEQTIVTAEANIEDAGVGALEWLMENTSNPLTKSIVLQSLGAFSPAMASRLQTSFDIPDDLVLEELTTVAGNEDVGVKTMKPGSEGKVERLLRSRLHIQLHPPSHFGPYYLIRGVTDSNVQAVMVTSKFLPIITSSEPFAPSRWTALSFLEQRILGCSDIDGSPPLPRLVWDALVQATIQEHDTDFGRSFNPAINLRLCELICPTISSPVDAASTMKSPDLLPTGYALDNFVIHVLSPGHKYPTTHRLAVMLVMSDYLSTTDNLSDTSLEMMRSIWWSFGARVELYDVEHRLLVRRKAEELLQGSSRFNPSRWEVMNDPGLLVACWEAILLAYHRLSISHVTFLREPFTLSPTLHSVIKICPMLDTRETLDVTTIVEKLWTFALDCHHPAAFDAVLEDNVLGTFPPPILRTPTAMRVASFISGITRQGASDRYITYLMQPEHLLGACWILAGAGFKRPALHHIPSDFMRPFLNQDEDVPSDFIECAVLDLVRLRPQNSSWDYVRGRLCSHLEQHPVDGKNGAIPPPVQFPLPPPPLEPDQPSSIEIARRIDFLRNLRRVQKVIEDHFTSKPVLDSSSLFRGTVLRRLRPILPEFGSLDQSAPAIQSASQV